MATFVWAAALAGNWSVGANWQVGGVPQAAPPTAADDVLFGSGTGATQVNCTIDIAGLVCRSVDATGFTATLTHTAGVTLTIGDGTAGLNNNAWKLAAGMTYTVSATSTLTFVSTVTGTGSGQVIDFAGKSFGLLTFNGTGGRWNTTTSLLGISLNNSQVTVTRGHLDLSGPSSHTFGVMSSSSANVRAITLGSGQTINITTNGAQTFWTFATSTNLTFSGATASIVLAATSGSSVLRVFRGGGQTYGTLSDTLVGGATPILSITQSNTFGTLNVSGGTRTLRLEAGSTQTVTTFNVFGTTGNLVTLESNSAGSAATLSKASGNVDAQYLSIKDSTATGGASWWAENSTSVSGNTGWTFGARRTITDGEGLTDSRAVVQTHVRSQTDAEGLTDAMAKVAGYARPFTEAEGLTDAASRVVSYIRPLTDAEGLTDPRTVAAAYVRSFTDALGLTDLASPAASYQPTFTDPLGMTDAATDLVAYVRTLTDGLGLVDAAAAAADYTRALTDVLGITDAAVVAATYPRAFTDQLGLTDTMASALTARRTLTDPLGLTDSVVPFAVRMVIITDHLGLTDHAAVLRAAIVTITDVLGLHDRARWLQTVDRHAGCMVVDPTGRTCVVVEATTRECAPSTVGPTGDRRNP